MNPNSWDKKDWIKDVLSKSGTDLVEIKDEKTKELRKMVYYPSLPLIMKSDHHRQHTQNQFCSPLNGETQIYHIPQSSHLHLLQQPSQQSTTISNGHQSNGTSPSHNSSTTTTTLLIPSNSSFLQNIKLEQQSSQSSTTTSLSSLSPLSSSMSSSHHQLSQNLPSSSNNNSNNGSNNLSTNNNNNNNRNTNRQNTTPPIKPQFKCDQCNMIFGSKSAHTSHTKSHKKQQQQVQQQQQQIQQSDNNFTIGQIVVTGQQQPGPLPTAIAQVSSTGGGTDPYQCNVCQKTFAVPARLIRHYRTHTGERPFECEFCHKMFSVKENLQVHRRIHTKERPYKCDVCGRAFEHSGKLHRHMRIHTGERPHKCSVCSKTFIQSGQLVIHMRTHTGEKPYKCPVEGCGKGFTCSKQLKVHSRTHTGEKPYHCDICFRDFGYNHVLKLHKVQHYGSKCYKCTICDETFKSKKEMEAHIKGHANEIPDDDDATTVADEDMSTRSPQLSHSQSPVQHQQQQQIQQQQQQQPLPILKQMDVKEEPRYRRSIESTSYKSETETSPPSPIYHHTHQPIQISTNNIPLDMETIESEQNMDYNHQSSTPSPNRNEVYTNVYSRFEQAAAFAAIQQQQQQRQQHSNHPTINPALLAAATIASRRVEEANQLRRLEISSPPPASLSNESAENSNEELNEYYRIREQERTPIPTQQPVHQDTEQYSPEYAGYEALDTLRQRPAYFPPAPVAEYKPSYRANDIVRQVEAAIAGAGLSPPRSTSTESPERSSSPESDTMMMADRDVMTLPLRKRKLYLNDNQTSKDVPPAVVRMSSVIQFAKAS